MNRDIIYKELVQLDLEAESTDEVFLSWQRSWKKLDIFVQDF